MWFIFQLSAWDAIKDPDCSMDECSTERFMVKRQRNHNYTSKGSPAVPDLFSHVSLLFLFWHVRYSRMSLSLEHMGPGVCTENLKNNSFPRNCPKEKLITVLSFRSYFQFFLSTSGIFKDWRLFWNASAVYLYTCIVFKWDNEIEFTKWWGVSLYFHTPSTTKSIQTGMHKHFGTNRCLALIIRCLKTHLPRFLH